MTGDFCGDPGFFGRPVLAASAAPSYQMGGTDMPRGRPTRVAASATAVPPAKANGANLRFGAQRLAGHGIKENAASIANKLARGTFAATFFLAAMKAIGRNNVNLADL